MSRSSIRVVLLSTKIFFRGWGPLRARRAVLLEKTPDHNKSDHPKRDMASERTDGACSSTAVWISAERALPTKEAESLVDSGVVFTEVGK